MTMVHVMSNPLYRLMNIVKISSILLLTSVLQAPAAAETVVEMDTSKGNITLELYPDRAPKTVENFLRYVDAGYYNGLIFHRVIEDWIIQTGGYDGDFMMHEAFEPVRSEATNGLKNERGTIAMARMMDPHSADMQFFINLADNPSLDHRARTFSDYGYTVFGRVVEGMDVADAIGEVKTHEVDGFEDVPVEPVMLHSVKILSRD